MILTIITTVVGALCVAGVLGLIKSRWLYIIVPKLYMNTPLSDGQIISLSIYNAGLTSEEDVAISFRPACKFELIATSKSTLNVRTNIISIPKLSRLETVNALLLFEGKAFDPVDIESVESKSAKGKIVDAKEKATAAWQSVVAIPLILILLSFLALPFAFGTVIGAEMGISAFKYLNYKLEIVGPSKQLSNYKESVRESYAQGKLEGALRNSKIAIKTKEVIRREEILTLEIEINNNTKDSLMAEGYFDSPAGDGPLDFWASRVDTFALGPNEKKLIKLKVFLPETYSVKMLKGRFSFETIDGDSLNTIHVMEFK